MAGKGAKGKITIEGRLEAYVAGPDRGVLWSIHEDARPGPEGVHPLLNGDFLTVYGEEGAVLWDGIVDLDFEMLQQPDAGEGGRMKQMLLGRWVHGVQKYYGPEDWARLFLDRRRARLRRFPVPPAVGRRV